MDVYDALDQRLRSRTGTGLDRTPLARALYSSDASVYRVPPAGIWAPRNADDVSQLLQDCFELGIPVTTRGAGTSCCGNAIGPGVIMDMSRHLTAIRSIDPHLRTATVEPGVVQASLQKAASGSGLRFGPDPSTADRCTIGGMIGNNACGPRALGYGRTSDNVISLTAVLAQGETITLGPGLAPPPSLKSTLDDIVTTAAPTISDEFGRFSRQISGYALDQLAAGNLPGLIVGSEGTLAIVTQAELRLVPEPAHTMTVALGYPSMADAADDIVVVLQSHPTACEGLDERIVDVVRRRGLPVPDLPQGAGWNLVEVAGDDPAELRARAERIVADSAALEGWVISSPLQERALWRIRADGAGYASVAFDRPAFAGWEDAAVPPQHLGSYLRDFESLLEQHELRGLPYGHFGDGCVHCRIDFPMYEPGGTHRYGQFLTDAAALVASYGGSLSGEHGDGRARSSLLNSMFSDPALKAMRQVKQAFDPTNALNPGILVSPTDHSPVASATAHVRGSSAQKGAIWASHQSFSSEVHQCSGIGKCLVNNTDRGGVMCPSYQATGREQDSTRGRARVLQEMIAGTIVTDGWASDEVAEALDLCLACKGCSSDCPSGVDMAAYKSQVLHEAFRGRLRPLSHYSMGWLPVWARIISRFGLAGVVNRAARSPLAALGKRAAGVDPRRGLPIFATGSARSRTKVTEVSGAPVAVWVDSWTDSFAGSHAEAVLRVLSAAGYAPQLCSGSPCCGLPWITTGQRDVARRHIRSAMKVFEPYVEAGIPIVATEPSCLAVWRSDAIELVGAEAERYRDAIMSMAELLSSGGWEPPSMEGQTLVVQPHCHHRAVVGWEADEALLAATQATVVTVGGCCGLAGNFGFEQGHYDVSVAVAELNVLPALRAHPSAVFVGDGFSCRTQVHDLTGRDTATVAQVLAQALDRNQPTISPKD